MTNHNKLRETKAVSLILAMGVGMSACGSNETSADSESTSSPTPTSVSTPTAATPDINSEIIPPVEDAIFKFDDLDGGSSIIMVYPGTSEAPENKHYNATYNDGDELPIYCQESGREVASDPTVGEEERQSSEWYLVNFTPEGEAQYATAVYGEVILGNSDVIPDCDTVL